MRLKMNKQYNNAIYNTNKKINMYQYLFLRFSSVWFGFEKVIRNLIRS